MASENPLWGEERMANELLLKLGIRVSPRTVRKYLPRHPRGRPRGDLRWSTFLRLHARGLIACDFFVAAALLTSMSPGIRPRLGHYIGGRPHMALGPGVPDPPVAPLQSVDRKSRHRLPEGAAVRGKPVLDRLHHEYSLAPMAA